MAVFTGVVLSLHIGDGRSDDLGVVDKGFADLRLGEVRDISGNILKFYGINGFFLRAGHGSCGLPAAELPDDRRQNCNDQQHDQQVDQIDLAEQTAFFIDQFHVVPPKEFAVDLPHGIRYNIRRHSCLFYCILPQETSGNSKMRVPI